MEIMKMDNVLNTEKHSIVNSHLNFKFTMQEALEQLQEVTDPKVLDSL